ncbi:TetR family transcriptional regulator [Rhodococcus sp. IEGM 1379]|uniref:TetR/AcrR family transcriptional regulator n=1 Tax=Rhodococcus sp. IEGM 1379 TaxID=3047086 RepID=UPI0024B66D71|nr:TetR family transcriptional regulator [Rhodococcus sp. IEGM 1379]MDI9915911.1 TetR family transcriptional regulator [Rhodococcus sp. IEGM 1379]
MSKPSPARDAITDVADRMFAERGVDEVSLREIVIESGQKNVSAVQYYFGGRDGLFLAVFRRRLAKLNEARSAYLEVVDSEGRGEDIRSLIEVSIVPLADYLRSVTDGSHYARFSARMTPRVDFTSRDFADISGVSREIIVRLRRALVHLPEDAAATRVDLIMNMMVSAFAAYEQRQEEGLLAGAASFDDMVTHLIEMAVGALTAPHNP